ncbi:hypothetical protein TA3x_001987 [Tundrisphaera sp. TA3]|uniref:hypothetical protein n=1 Tax=Tundrisphaera sp. TA3 TaxID=3435775 RepID=UPI003EBADFA7
MLLNNSFNLRYVDAQNFSQNASRMLLDGGTGKFVSFLDSLSYPVRPDKNDTGFYGVCPVCRSANVFLGTNGKSHLIYWKCLDKSGACETNRTTFKTPKNLLSLTRFILGSQGAAYKAIATFLGHGDRPFNITNGKTGTLEGYLFVVENEELKARFDRAGFFSIVYDGEEEDSKLNRMVVVIVMDQGGDALADILRARGSVVSVQSPRIFDGMTGERLADRARSVMRVAMAPSA